MENTKESQYEVGNTAIYKGFHREIVDIDMEEMLFLIQDREDPSDPRWVRIENCHYVPF
jgi:hypothetical protein